MHYLCSHMLAIAILLFPDDLMTSNISTSTSAYAFPAGRVVRKHFLLPGKYDKLTQEEAATTQAALTKHYLLNVALSSITRRTDSQSKPVISREEIEKAQWSMQAVTAGRSHCS